MLGFGRLAEANGRCRPVIPVLLRTTRTRLDLSFFYQTQRATVTSTLGQPARLRDTNPCVTTDSEDSEDMFVSFINNSSICSQRKILFISSVFPCTASAHANHLSSPAKRFLKIQLSTQTGTGACFPSCFLLFQAELLYRGPLTRDELRSIHTGDDLAFVSN